MDSQIAIRLLGQLEVEVSGRPVQLDGAKQRALLAALALRAPEPVSVDALVEALWGERPPTGAVQALQKQISRLRRRLGEAGPRLRHRPPGYALDVDPSAIDSRRFERLLRDARRALSRGDAEAAVEGLTAALGLWRGEPLADFRFEEFAQHEIARLEELRLDAIEERLAAELARGGGEELVGELQALVAEHPLRERLRAQLMVALYRAGRQAEALEAMRVGRQLLVDELGIEPGPELRRLERMILAHDPELGGDRPAARLAARLPAPANETIGRSEEIEAVGQLLIRDDVRLVTLLGPPGVGKTRLGLEAARAVAARFPAGVVHVGLAGAGGGAALVAETASALGMVAGSAGELGARLAVATRGGPALLVLDGVERYVEEAELVAELIAAAENLTVLATSRAPLRLTAEHVYRVLPLGPSEAVALFAARAQAVRADTRGAKDPADVVAAICSRLDGLPLAIELAADQARFLPLPALRDRLDRRLELLSTGPRDLPARQQSLRATLEWSWDVLDESERTLLGRLAVFESGASLDAAQAVCGDGLNDGVEAVASSLLEKCSLLRVRTGRDGEPRLTMLDTVREFATQQHAAGEDLAELELRHARYFLDYCERTAERAARTAQREWLDLLGQERGNIGVAFQRLMERGLAEEALRLAVAFARALPWDAHAHRVRRWLQQALDASAELPAGRRAQGLYWAGMLALSQGLFADAHAQLAAALTLTSDAPAEAAVLCALGRCAVFVAAGDAGAVCDRALDAARAVGEPSLIAEAQLTAAGACERAESWERAGALAGVALELFRAAGDSYGAASALAEQAWYDIVHHRLGDAEPRLEEALELRRAHGDDRRLVEPLIEHAWLLHVRGAGEAAEAAFLECLALARHVGDRFIVGEALAGLSAQAALEARWSDAALLAGASAAMHGHIGAPPWASVTAIQERALAAARDALGELYAREFAAGGRLAAEEAVARTRAEPRRPAAIAGR